MDALSKILTPAYLRKLDTMDIARRFAPRRGLPGSRPSSGKGGAAEFSDYKEYTPGDDIRQIDWHSYARLNKLFVKQFSEERQAVYRLYIDTSRSMDFGARNKAYFAKALAASLAYLCLKHTDRVDLYAINHTVTGRKERISAKGRFHEIVRFLDGLTFGGKTNLNAAVAAGGTQTRADQSYLLSDFFTKDGYAAGAQQLARTGDVTFVQILSAEETTPALSGPIQLIDSETKERLTIMADKALHRQYQAALTAMREEIEIFCAKKGMVYRFADTAQSTVFEQVCALALSQKRASARF